MSDIESYLEPISAESPSGPDLRYTAEDSTFDLLKETTTSVASVDEDDEGKEPDWWTAQGLCHAALQEKTKDLELICNLLEAWVRQDGLSGLENGIALMHGCVDRFWDTIHPGIDPDDGELSYTLRARWLNWMDNAKGLQLALKGAPIVPAPEGAGYGWRDYENTELLSDATLSEERHAELVEAGVIDEGQWLNAVGTLSTETLREYVSLLEASLQQARALSELCRAKFEGGDDEAPDLYNLINLVEAMRDYFAGLVADAAPLGDPSVAGEGVATATGEAASTAVGAIATRADALRVLAQVGDFFRRTEPHSPISYLIARAVKWGGMPLDALFKDVVRNEDVIGHIWETLGIDAPRSDDD
jgi:type VI secretion system protein ImpA